VPNVITLDGIPVGSSHHPYCIAELGHNHMGDLREAKKLISMAAAAGVQATKIQKRNNRELYTDSFYNSPYNSENAYAPTYGAHRDYLEFSSGEYFELQDHADQCGVSFIATAFDLPSLEFLQELDVPYFKIASGSIQNPLLLRETARLGKPVLASLGGAGDELVRRVAETILKENDKLVLLHCTAAYPAKPEELGLGRIEWLADEYPECVIGYSDHDDGIALAAAAYAYGARVFEKHVTLDHTNKGTDHAFSLEPGGLHAYVKNLHEAYVSRVKLNHPINAERRPIYKMGYAVYPARDLPKELVIKPTDLVIKSPADGIPAWEFDSLIGRRLTRDIKKEEKLDWSDFDGEH